INLMWQQGGALRQATIFAGVPRALLYPRAHGLRHRQEAIRGAQYSSVWSLSTLSRSLSRTMCSYSACSSCESVPAVLLSASSVTRPDRSFSTAAKAASNFSNVCFSIPTLPPHGISIPTWTPAPLGHTITEPPTQSSRSTDRRSSTPARQGNTFMRLHKYNTSTTHRAVRGIVEGFHLS